MAVQNVKKLEVYRKADALAMDIFELSKAFSAEERFALTSQIRRSSRSVAMNLREAWHAGLHAQQPPKAANLT